MNFIFVVVLMLVIAAFVAVRPKPALQEEGAGALTTRASDTPFELKRALLIIGPSVNFPACSEQRGFIKPIVKQLLDGGHRLVEIYGDRAPAQNGVSLDWLDNQLLRSTFDAETGFHMLYVDDHGRLKFKVSSPILGDAIIMIVDPADGRLALPAAEEPVSPEPTYIDTEYGYDPDNPPPPSPMAALSEEETYGPDVPPPRPDHEVSSFPEEPTLDDFDETLFEKPDFDQFLASAESAENAHDEYSNATTFADDDEDELPPMVTPLRAGRPAGLYNNGQMDHSRGHSFKASGYFTGEQHVTSRLSNPFAQRAKGLYDAVDQAANANGSVNGHNGQNSSHDRNALEPSLPVNGHGNGGANGHGSVSQRPNGLYDKINASREVTAVPGASAPKKRITFRNISISGD